MKKLKRFLRKAKQIHGSTYDYSHVAYTDCNTKVCIKCKTHGKFLQNPTLHLSGAGCPKCKRKNIVMLTTKDYITKCKLKFGDKYDYSETVYTSTKSHITVRCKLHGIFTISANKHLAYGACPDCGKESRKLQHINTLTKRTLNFIDRATTIHGDMYDYSDSVYTNAHTKISIRCKIHGLFDMFPYNHINQKSGCRLCGFEKMKCISSKCEIEWLDSIKHITNRMHPCGKYFADGFDKATNTVYEFLGNYWHGKISDMKSFNVDYINKYMYTFFRFNELSKLGYTVKYIWEDEWIKAKKNRTTPPLHTFKQWEKES